MPQNSWRPNSKIINQQRKQNYTHIPGFGKVNGFAGKSMGKTSRTSMSSGFEAGSSLAFMAGGEEKLGWKILAVGSRTQNQLSPDRLASKFFQPSP
jgi:hypothetical protein